MNENKTFSILQRLPVILAVTAASYGLNVAQAETAPRASMDAKARTAAQVPKQAKRDHRQSLLQNRR